MLVLCVKEADYIMIGDDIKVSFFLNKEKTRVSRVGVDAPKGIPILRQAVYERYNGITPDRAVMAVSDL